MVMMSTSCRYCEIRTRLILLGQPHRVARDRVQFIEALWIRTVRVPQAWPPTSENCLSNSRKNHPKGRNPGSSCHPVMAACDARIEFVLGICHDDNSSP